MKACALLGVLLLAAGCSGDGERCVWTADEVGDRCGDDIDNDCDGDVDCADPDCASTLGCGGCTDEECLASCVETGWGSGACAGSDCECSNVCDTNEQCAQPQTICYRGECHLMWGLEYAFTIVESHLPERQWWDGECYTTSCDPPTVQVELAVGGVWSCATDESSGTYEPVWDTTCNYYVNEGSTIMWRLMSGTDVVFESEPGNLSESIVKGGEALWDVEYESSTYDLLYVTIGVP